MAIELNVVDNAPIGLSVDAGSDINLSVGETTIVSTSDYEELRNKPSIGGVELTGDMSLDEIGGYTQSQIDTKLSGKADTSDIPSLEGYATEIYVNAAVPKKTSQLTNDSGYISSYTETDPLFVASAAHGISPSDIASWNGKSEFSGSYNDLANKPTIPSKVSDLENDAGYMDGMTILSYGNSTWQNFIDAYSDKKVVYCRASSNSNPASGSQTRLAFMAYVNNAESPTEVEFQYYRSVSSHTSAQQGDQVFVYKLTKTGGWTVTTREASSKIATGTGLSSSYSNGTITLSLASAIPSKVSDLTNDSGFLTLADLPIYDGGVS